jgi:hypothetical protein
MPWVEEQSWVYNKISSLGIMALIYVKIEFSNNLMIMLWSTSLFDNDIPSELFQTHNDWNKMM